MAPTAKEEKEGIDLLNQIAATLTDVKTMLQTTNDNEEVVSRFDILENNIKSAFADAKPTEAPAAPATAESTETPSENKPAPGSFGSFLDWLTS